MSCLIGFPKRNLDAMIYHVDDIKEEVRIVLDRNCVSSPLSGLGDVDTLSLDDMIENSIEDAARIVESSAPSHLLDKGRLLSTKIGWDKEKGNGSGYVPLPDDFMRLISFQMSDWSHPVTEAITEEDPRYALQRSRYCGVRGTPQNPVVAITKWPTGLVLEFFSCNAGSDVAVKRARYIPIPKIEDVTGIRTIDLCEKLKASIVYYIAYLVALIVEPESSLRLLETSRELMR